MNTDIRLLLSFRGHPKTKKLRLKLGEAGPLGFIYLLMHAAESKPDGVLDGMDREDIALAADYRGDVGEFVDTLLAVRLLDFDGETFSIHDWEANNPWAAGHEERSQHAKKAAAARWKREKGLDFGASGNQTLKPKDDAPGMNEQSGEQNPALQPAQSGNAPSPSPSPIPSPTPNLVTSIPVFNGIKQMPADSNRIEKWANQHGLPPPRRGESREDYATRIASCASPT